MSDFPEIDTDPTIEQANQITQLCNQLARLLSQLPDGTEKTNAILALRTIHTNTLAALGLP